MHISKKLLIILLVILTSCSAPKKCCGQGLNKIFKFSTFYAAVNGGTSIADIETFSVTDGLQTSTFKFPYDYNIALGVRKIARFGYENKAQTFYDGTEDSWSDAATLGKMNGLEFLFEHCRKRQEGVDYTDQHHFVRYVANNWVAKVEYLVDGFADIEYYEASQRARWKLNDKFSLNVGAVQRIAEPYGYDPLDEWLLDNGGIHYTYLAIQEGYNIDVYEGNYYDPEGNIIATSKDVWESVIIPDILAQYVEDKRNELPAEWNHSLVLGFDYYKYTKKSWLHAWANVMPYHYNMESIYSYHNFIEGQWYDYSGGLICGWKLNKNIGAFVEGKYNKYWNRTWYDFKFGINYIIF